MKLSIIVPVYNLEKYIGPCLESLTKIALSPKEYEILVIDDGSQDGSVNVIESFVREFDQVSLIKQENIGVGAARNLGLTKASGKYVWLVDGDDLVCSDKVPAALEEALTQNVDALAFNFDAVNEDGNSDPWIKFELKFEGNKALSGPEFYYLNYAKSYLWLYFFKREIFVKGNLKYHESIKMQDGELMPKIFMHCEKVGFHEEALIKYRYRPSSAVNNADHHQRAYFYQSMVTVAKSLAELQQQFDKNDIMFKAIQLKRNQMNQMLFTNLVSNKYSDDINQKFISMLKNNGLLPFAPITGFTPKMNFKYNLIRKLVNINPQNGRTIYQKFIM
ncbi:MAG TPA: glycosyltransferase [Anditalea sp.]|nr:glycosyltransferase [Anditalea sp.]